MKILYSKNESTESKFWEGLHYAMHRKIKF